MSEPYYLDVEDVLTAARYAAGTSVEIRDFGLLASAVARPATTMFGQDAYPQLHEKAAALLHSLARNHALVDGNERTAWAAAWVFLEVNGEQLRTPLDEGTAEELVLAVAQGKADVSEITIGLRSFGR
ncbi:death-on-curing protein [Saccharopolyspora lacisalsi]|uniref:Death-on-curing protein n=1 Tax=Halosaccharopolyspora lacisalsi TaxID=1000566 RepID=A0A839DWH0_9PSEU|nr:type II toxin-antitoxin system death-on-curing family toxin [Halosaccharopolyspora lacisalsi]MBA8825854.1 death-on-curing protein [Halosaccharopolyspora lacisalsi]